MTDIPASDSHNEHAPQPLMHYKDWISIFILIGGVALAYWQIPGFHGYFQMLVLISVLVIAHEIGHFWVAKRCGVKVERFGLGLPIGPTLWERKIGETIYCVHIALLGGYVSFADDDPNSDLPEDSPQRFENQPLWNRAAITSAGVIVNFILGYVFMLTVLLGWGEPDVLIKVHQLLNKEVPAATAGMQPGDIILKMDNKRVSFNDFEGYKAYLKAHINEPVQFTIKRNQQVQTITASPNEDGLLGFIPAVEYMFVPMDNPANAFVRSFTFLSEKMQQQFIAIGKIIQGDSELKKSLSGPIGIVMEGGTYIKTFGFAFGLMISALLSVMLAVINILPIPMLDGGHLLFIGLEAVIGKPVNKTVRERLTQVGFVMLMSLMVFVIFNDVMKYVVNPLINPPKAEEPAQQPASPPADTASEPQPAP